MGLLNEKLGNYLTTMELSEYIGLDQKTVRKYYLDLGGIRIGRHYRFFEMEVLNAIQTRNEVHCADKEEWEEKGKSFQDQEGSGSLGSENATNVRCRLERDDKHHLFG